MINILHNYKRVKTEINGKLVTERIITPGFTVCGGGCFFITKHKTLKLAKEEVAWREKTIKKYDGGF